MTAQPCWQSIKVVALRATRLLSSGAVATGLKGVYVTSGIKSVQRQSIIKDRQEFESVNGSGAICSSYATDPDFKGETLNMLLCDLDAEMLELTTGWTILTDLEGDSVGLAEPAQGATPPNGTCIEAWSVAWDGTAQALSGASQPMYIRHVWPRVKSRLGDYTLDVNILEVPVTGRGNSNPLLTAARGVIGDWPIGTPSGTPYFWYYDPSLPVAQCGYTAAPPIS